MGNLRTLKWLLHATGIAVLLATVAGYYVLVGRAVLERSEGDRQYAEHLERQIASAEHVYVEHRSLHEEISALMRSLEETHRRVPREMYEEQFLSEAREVATSTGLTLSRQNVGASESLANYSKANVVLEGYGSFRSIAKFLDGIDQLARITEISKLSLASDTNFGSYPLQVVFVLYYGAQDHDTEEREGVL